MKSFYYLISFSYLLCKNFFITYKGIQTYPNAIYNLYQINGLSSMKNMTVSIFAALFVLLKGDYLD